MVVSAIFTHVLGLSLTVMQALGFADILEGIRTGTSPALVALVNGPYGGIAVLALISLLALREASIAMVELGATGAVSLFSKYATILIVPPLVVFALIVAVKILEAL